MSKRPGNQQPHEAATDSVAVWMRVGFRLIATVGLMQTFLGLCLIGANPWIGYIDDAFLLLVFGGSSILLFRSQPQFAAIFALIPSAYAEYILSTQHWAYLPASILISPAVWLLLLQHPVALPRKYTPLIILAAALALVAGVASSLAESGGIFGEWAAGTVVLHYGMLSAGAAILCQRCFSEGLLKSPRTIIFALSLAPTSLVLIAAPILGVEALPESIVALMNCSLAIAPVGTLLFEFAQRRKQLTKTHLKDVTL